MRRRSGSADSVVLPVPERPKKKRRVPVRADIGGAVHRQNTLIGEHVIQHREDGLLDLAGVVGPADQNLALLEVDHDEGARGRPVLSRIGFHSRCVQHREFGLEDGQLLRCGPEEHVVGEQVVPRVLIHKPDVQNVIGIGAGTGVPNKEFLPVQKRDDLLSKSVELLLAKRSSNGVPINGVPGQ